MRGPLSVWRGGNESECLLLAQEGHFEGSLDLKGEEELMLGFLAVINVIG